MRENYRNSIASIEKFPQFTTMHVIDGQAGLIICASLIFYSLTIDNILNIIVLLILAAISISMLTGDNSIIKNAVKAKESSEISEEKEIVEKATVQAMGKNKYGNITKENLKEYLDKIIGENKTKVYNDENFIVHFIETGRVYTVDSEGEVQQADTSKLTQDSTPGAFEGTGKEENPFIIMSIEDLVFLSQDVLNNSYKYDKKFIKLGKDLNFESELSYCNYETKDYNEFLEITDDVGLMEILTNKKYSGFKPIVSFRGTFDGDNQYIKNLYINNSEYAGLFKSLVGTVQNLKLSGEIKCSGNYAGSIASNGGTANNFISNCISYVNIDATGDDIGGIMGTSSTYIKNCINYGIIKGNNTTGGICGQYGYISDCVNYGEVIGTGDQIGGVMGQANKYLKDCKNFGNITGSTKVGGVVGNSGGCANCFNYGNIKATLRFAGGISGYVSNTNTTINCYNKGSIESATYVGGILGVLSYTSGTTSRIINCYNIGDVKGNKYVGGIVGAKDGYGNSYIDHSYWKEVNGLNGYFNTGGNGGTLEVTNTQAYSEEFIKSQEFIDILNSFVNTYNAGEYETSPDKTYSSSEDLLRWKSGEDGYPVFE